MRIAIIISAILLAIGVSGAGWLAGQSLERSREPIRTVTVKGLAEQQVKADLGFWPIKFVATGPTLDAARAELEQAEQSVRSFLGEQGFGSDDILVQNIKVEDRFTGYNGANYPAEARFTLTEELLVTTNEVDQLVFCLYGPQRLEGRHAHASHPTSARSCTTICRPIRLQSRQYSIRKSGCFPNPASGRYSQ